MYAAPYTAGGCFLARLKQNDGTSKAAAETLAEAVVETVQDSDLIALRRDQICEAALELFLKKGFSATTIRDICAGSGVNQASIYDYVANKNDILRRLLNKLWFRTDVLTMTERLDQNPQLPLNENLADYFRETWSTKRKGTLLAYRAVPHLQSDDRKAMRSHEQERLILLADRLRQYANLSADDRRPEIIANMIIFLSAFAPMRDWLMDDIDEDLILHTVAGGVAAMLDRIAEQNPES